MECGEEGKRFEKECASSWVCGSRLNFFWGLKGEIDQRDQLGGLLSESSCIAQHTFNFTAD